MYMDVFVYSIVQLTLEWVQNWDLGQSPWLWVCPLIQHRVELRLTLWRRENRGKVSGWSLWVEHYYDWRATTMVLQHYYSIHNSILTTLVLFVVFSIKSTHTCKWGRAKKKHYYNERRTAVEVIYTHMLSSLQMYWLDSNGLAWME